MTINLPSRSDVWRVVLDPTVGHEQGGTRPCLVFSVTKFNHSRADLVVVLPITSRYKGIVSHVKVAAGEGGLIEDSYVKCEEIRCVSKDRFKDLWGRVGQETMDKVATNVRFILGL